MSILSLVTLQNFVAAWVTAIAFVLFLISVIAYRRSRNSRIGIVSAAFFLFFIEGIVFTYQLFDQYFALSAFFIIVGVMDIGILLLIFAATQKK
ncbi:MAG: hypothetical protein KHF84_04945 [Thermoplasmata archaeon]|nr:hypothetical protein [Candidatus Sysuiplasma jiujiangense]